MAYIIRTGRMTRLKKRVKKFNGFYPAQIGEDFWIVNVSMDYRELVEIVNKHLYTSMIMVGAIPILFIFYDNIRS